MKKGFTLIELMVSISIFVVISGVIIANLRGGTLRDELALGSTNLVEAIRDANIRTTSGELVNICSGGINDGDLCQIAGCGVGVCVGVLPSGGFGVHLNPVTPGEEILYKFFADINGNLNYDENELIKSAAFIASKNVRIKSVTPANPNLTITFRPPKPSAYINGTLQSSSADIVLEHKFTDEEKTVHFERVSGLIGIQQ